MPMSPADIALKWEDDAQQLQFGEAARIRSAAQTWTGYITGFLGVVGLAGVAFVPSNLKDVTGSAHDLVLWLGVAVIVLGLGALVLAALASGSLPQQVWNDGDAYRVFSQRAARRGIQQLRWSRGLTFAALGCLLLAAVLATINPGRPPATPPLALVTQSGGPVLCGAVITDPQTGVVALQVGSGLKELPNALTVNLVARCGP